MTSSATEQANAPEQANETRLYDALRGLGIGWQLHEHPPLRTVEESKRLRGELPGAHVKNLLLRDKKKRLFLVTALEDRLIDLKALRKRVGGHRSFRFADADVLLHTLGVTPGAVTPWGLVCAQPDAVTFVLDAGLLEHDVFNAHPLRNDRTITAQTADLLRFAEARGFAVLVVDLATSDALTSYDGDDGSG